MALKDDLKELGLNGSEIKVYLYLLEHGISSPPQIARGTGIVRTSTYHLLQSLRDKGLIKEQHKGKRSVYMSADPSATLGVLERKRELMEGIIPDLQALHKKRAHKPSIKFYEGFEEVKRIYLATLEAEEVFAVGSTQKLEKVSPEFFQHYQKQIKKHRLIFQDLLSHDAKGKTAHVSKEALGLLYDVRFLPKSVEELDADIFIWDNHIGLIILEEPILGMVITSPHLSKTFRALFSLAWTAAER